jgi:AcrR family transcriptional regulator
MKATKEDIIKAAAKLFFSKGYEAATTTEIAVTSGLANSSCIFKHFKNKEEIYKHVVEKYVVRAQTPKQKFGDCTDLSLKEFIEEYVNKVEKTMTFLHDAIGAKNKTANKYFSFLLESADKEEESAKIFLLFNNEEIGLWQIVIERAKETGEILPHINSFNMAKQFRYAFIGISYVFSVENGVSAEQIRETLYNLYDTIKK